MENSISDGNRYGIVVAGGEHERCGQLHGDGQLQHGAGFASGKRHGGLQQPGDGQQWA